MSITEHCRYSVPFALTLLLAACGGGGGEGEGGLPVDNTGTVNATDLPTDVLGEANSIVPAVTVSGRVADGYIRGATVCVDINGNDACDSDEPSAVTGEGGIYDLEVPEGHSDKPIVAAIPAEAIDEDTGEAVGQALVFIAPADRPEFVSPITTLVHQEQRANPALNSEEAEQAVKNFLGVDETDVSLFSDYVAQSDATENTDGTAARFDYLHDAARVVASMMKDIESQIENAAVSRGVDVAGSDDTRRAIQEIVRNQIRELLPQIARQVTEIVSNAESASASGTESIAAIFDPQALAVSLRPDVEDEYLTDRIEANINRAESVDSDLRSLLSNGVYWIEFDCHYDHYDEYGSTGPSENADMAVNLSDITMFPMPECEAMYGKVQLSEDGSELASEQYLLDAEGGTWLLPEREDDSRYANYSLVNGEWMIVSSDGPDGRVEFLSSNSAVVTNDEGTMQLKSVTQVLDSSPVIHHLLEDGADPMWFELIGQEDIFPSESKAHRISVRQTYHPYVMFNFAGHESDESSCVDYNGNCNVVDIVTDGQYRTVVSLSQLRESLIQGVSLRTPSRIDALMRLQGVVQADGTLPTQGSVQWNFGGENHTSDFESNVDTDYVDVAPIDPNQAAAGDVEPLDVEILDRVDGGDTSQSELNPEAIGVPVTALPKPWEFTSHEECVAVLTEEAEDSEIENEIPDDLFAPGEFEGTRDELAVLIGSGIPNDLFAPGEFEGTRDELAALIGSGIPSDLFAPGEFEGTRDELAVLIGEGGDEIEEERPSVDSFDEQLAQLLTGEEVNETCSLIMSETGIELAIQNDDSVENGNTDINERGLANQMAASVNGQWKMIEIDGVGMIEIHLPMMFRNESDGESDEAILLIEHNGFVRAGARLPDTRIDRVFTYNENAFVTLRSIVESGMGDTQ